MLKSGIFCKLALILALAASTFCHADPEGLKSEDINRIMKQIFEQHGEQKEMTASILKKSFKVYIDQFDPDRVYLLDQEVQPFLAMSDSQVQNMVSQYKGGKFPEFQQLNDIIQKAISRARTIRDSLEGANAAHLFQKSDDLPSDGNLDWSDPDLKRPFAKTVNELRNRMTQEVVKFIANERKRFGDAYVTSREVQTIRLFERQSHEHEDQYLFVNGNGRPMTETERQNAFAMHVLKALASALDAHTTVLNPTEAYDMRLRLEKEMQGVGIALRPSVDGFVISQVVKNGPAAKSGLVMVNDKLWEVDGTPVRNLPLSKVMDMLRGKTGTKVTLVLKRPAGTQSDKPVIVTLTREDIPINEDRAESRFVSTDVGNIGIIKLDSFYQSDNGVTSENDVRDAIKKLDQHGNLRGLILDLRENSGGFLSQAVKVAGLFITNGVIVVSKYFNGEEHFYRDMDGKIAYDGPLIVLTSKATASAAEIVAQALQDYGVAIVVGDERTYGKGSIQSQTVTENNQQDASTFFKVTVGKYYTVSGKTPQIQGVKADVVVPSQFVHDNIGEEFLDNPLKQDKIAPSYNDNLSDIAPNLKPWYMQYYAPTLQHKKEFWDNMIPELRKNSNSRINHNSDYELFIKGEPVKAGHNPEEMQLAETVAVMKDMIALATQRRGNEPALQGSKAQTAGIVQKK